MEVIIMNRVKLALKILFGYNIILYEINTKIVEAVISGKEDILKNGYDYVLDKGKNFVSNNGSMRYVIK